MLQRFVEQDRWHRETMQTALVGVKPGEEPDWFGAARYGVPVDPAASLEEQLRQWNTHVQPRVDKAIAEGRIKRQVAGKLA